MKSFLSIVVVLLSALIISLPTSRGGLRANAPSSTPSFDDKDDCVLPCWNNIIPAQTLWEEAEEYLKQLGFEIPEPRTEPTTGLIAYHIVVNSIDLKALEEGIVEDKSGTLSATILVKDEVVHSITLRFQALGTFLTESDANRQTWEFIEPSQFLTVYGRPDYFIVQEGFVSEGIAVATSLFWPERGISLTYIFRRLAQEGDLCWNLDDIDSATLRLYEPDNPELFEENIEQVFQTEVTEETDFEIVANVQTEEAFLDLMRNEGCMSIQLQPETPAKEFNFDFDW